VLICAIAAAVTEAIVLKPPLRARVQR